MKVNPGRHNSDPKKQKPAGLLRVLPWYSGLNADAAVSAGAADA